jgi:hypothetical protein
MSMKGRKVNLARFAQHLAIGRGLDMQSYLESGMRILGVPIRLSWFDATFMAVHFEGLRKEDQYLQLIPWSACGTVLMPME